MPAFLPLEFQTTDAPVDSHPGKMAPLNAPFQMEGLSKRIFEALPPTVSSRDHAIPHIGAYVEYLVDAVLRNRKDPYVTSWKGVLAMVAMNKLFNLNITIEEKNIAAPATFVSKVYKTELMRLRMLDNNNGTYYVVMRNGLPIAFIHPGILVCPLKNIAPAALADIPWYDALNKEWLELGDGKLLTYPEQLQLAAWLEKQRQASAVASPHLGNILTEWQGVLCAGNHSAVLSNPTRVPCAANNVSFGAVSWAGFTQVPNYAVSIEDEMFTRELLFAHAKTLSTTVEAEGLCLHDDNGKACPIVPPISAAFAKTLIRYSQIRDEVTQMPLLELVGLRVEHDAFAAERAVTVVMEVRNGTLTMRRTQRFAGQQLVYVKNFPYFSMWPYVNLAPEEWKLYTVSMVPHADITPPPDRCTTIDPSGSMLNFACEPNQLTLVRPMDKANFSYNVYSTGEFPLFVPLRFNNALGESCEGGCLQVKPTGPRVVENPATTAVAAIDFGTSNSVCAVRATGVTHKVLNGDRVRGLVDFGGSGSDAAVLNFHRYYGSSLASKNYKFPSVAQLFSNSGTEPVTNGQILLTEGGVIDYFASTNTNLKSIGIYSYLKSDTKSLLNEVNTAEELFIKQLTLLCALEAKCQGAGSIRYYFSYPNVKYRRTLETFWNSAISYIDSMGIFSSTERGAMTECDSAAYYVQTAFAAATAAAGAPGFAVADIGGGTTDMTVWRDPTGGQNPSRYGSLSFQYAGNQLFSKTFFNYFKGHLDVFSTIFPRVFNTSKLTGLAKERADSAVKSYMKSLKEIPSTKDESFPALTALLNTLFEEPGIDKVYWAGVPCRELRSLIAFKLKGILYVLGCLVRECNGINPEQGTFKTYLVGGGAQAYFLAGGDSGYASEFDGSAFTMLSRLIQIPQDGRPFSIEPPQNAEKKIEVVDGMLNCVLSKGNTNTAAMAAAARPGQPITPATLRSAYRVFIELTVKPDENLAGLLPLLELAPQANEGTPEQHEVNNRYMAVFANVWADVNGNLDRDASELIRLAAFSVRVAEELLG